MAESTLVGIPAELLILDPDVQARAAQDPQQIARLRMSDAQSWPPLLVTPNIDPERPGTFLIIDGAHRFLAGQHFESGKKVAVYPCEVRDGLGYEDSAEANLRHLALQLSTADRKLYAVCLHENDPELSAREIGRRVGLAPHTVISALKDPADSPGKKPVLPRFLSALLKADSEGQGFLKLGDRRKYVEQCILSSRNPAAVIESLDTWLRPLSEGADRARAKLADQE